jgi:hypothetical protein
MHSLKINETITILEKSKISESTAVYEQPKKYIGYWRKNFFNIFHKLPYPYSNIKKLNQNDIIEKIIIMLRKYAIVMTYFGWSPCRKCGIKNGNSEYHINYNKITYVIPFGYFHYLIDHNVKIDNILIEILNYYTAVNIK